MQHEHNFKTKLLYTQILNSEDETKIESRVFSASWLYPQAKAPTVERIRVTAVYFVDNTQIIVRAGMVEKWSSTGWLLLEEHSSDTVHSNVDEMVEYLLKLAESFITGVPYIVANETTAEIGQSDEVCYENVLDFNKKKME